MNTLRRCSLAAIEEAAKDPQALELHWGNEEKSQIMDATTANMFMKVFKALKTETQERVATGIQESEYNLIRTVALFWGVIK